MRVALHAGQLPRAMKVMVPVRGNEPSALGVEAWVSVRLASELAMCPGRPVVPRVPVRVPV